jgi:biotin transport system substrate-specific component
MNRVFIIDALWPSAESQNLIRNISIIVIGTILLTISAKIKIPIPPVPITLQTLVVLVFASAVGWRFAVSSFLFYLFLAFIGLPVFATPPYGGPAYFIGPAVGYLIGMLLASYIVGYLAEKNYDKNYFKSLGVIFIGTIVIFIPGLFWLGMWYNFLSSSASDLNYIQSYAKALNNGLLIYKFTEPVKVALAASITPLLWQYINIKKK